MIERLLKDMNSAKYVLATAMAKRAKAINAGAKRLVDNPGGKADMVALQELAEGKVQIKRVAPLAAA